MIGQVIMSIGTFGIIASVILEIKMKEPLYALVMKLAPLVFAYGVLLWQVG